MNMSYVAKPYDIGGYCKNLMPKRPVQAFLPWIMAIVEKII